MQRREEKLIKAFQFNCVRLKVTLNLDLVLFLGRNIGSVSFPPSTKKLNLSGKVSLHTGMNNSSFITHRGTTMFGMARIEGL